MSKSRIASCAFTAASCCFPSGFCGDIMGAAAGGGSDGIPGGGFAPFACRTSGDTLILRASVLQFFHYVKLKGETGLPNPPKRKAQGGSSLGLGGSQA